MSMTVIHLTLTNLGQSIMGKYLVS